ncbi:MAG: hypothetical protein ACYTGL_04320 [Planctomycetota bacterium]|jgi:hypothetical protein
MKTVSAAIVVLAGALILGSGAHVAHNDTCDMLMMIGGAVGLYGLIIWHQEMRRPTGGPQEIVRP